MSVLTEREKKSEVMLNKILARGSNSWSLTDIHDLEEVIRLLLQDSKDFQAQLSLSTKREERYRKALEEIRDTADKNYGDGYYVNVAHKALSSPTPEPVTVEVEELAQEIASAVRGNLIFRDSYYINTAKYLLSKFKVERKP